MQDRDTGVRSCIHASQLHKISRQVIGTTNCWSARLALLRLPHAPPQSENLRAAIT